MRAAAAVRQQPGTALPHLAVCLRTPSDGASCGACHCCCPPCVNCRLGGAHPKYLTPSEVREVLRRMWELNEPILAFIYPTGEAGTAAWRFTIEA